MALSRDLVSLRMFGVELLVEYVEEKVANYGAGVVMGVIAASPLGFALQAAGRFSEFVESGGIAELDKLSSGATRQLTRPLNYRVKGLTLLEKLQQSVAQLPPSRGGGRKAVWRSSDWASSREHWLADAWKHDWRSQPRIPAGSSIGGEWTDGRLDHPFVGAPAIGKGKQKSSRKSRRMRRYRRYGRLASRDFVRGLKGGG